MVLLVVLLAAVAVDVLLAASLRALSLSRSGDASARLGEPVQVELRVHNTGTRRFRGWVRDAWPPSARAEPARCALDLRPDGTEVVRTGCARCGAGIRPRRR